MRQFSPNLVHCRPEGAFRTKTRRAAALLFFVLALAASAQDKLTQLPYTPSLDVPSMDRSIDPCTESRFGTNGRAAIIRAMPIFVETLIHTPPDELWAATQEPARHARWDLRFSDIEYLPKSALDAPQRFLYRTRIGFGLDVAGEGESTGERSLADGSRTSALMFWSDDAKSLIREGSGFWKYEPAGNAIRFFTVYDYRARFGVAGRLLDRVAFRPLIAWATAWSFDRLRLWLEEGVRPEDALRLAIANAVAQTSLALVWIYQGLVPKLLVHDSGELALTIATVGATYAAHLLVAAGIGEIAIGIALLLFRRSRALLLASTAAVVALTVVGIAHTPSIAIAPFNAVTLTLGMLALTAVSLATVRGAPSASRTRWSPSRRRER